MRVLHSRRAQCTILVHRSTRLYAALAAPIVSECLLTYEPRPPK